MDKIRKNVLEIMEELEKLSNKDYRTFELALALFLRSDKYVAESLTDEELEELENMNGIVMENLDYKNECIFYLGLEIMKILSLDGLSMDIDVYYDIIKEIYEDYKKHDNNKKSFLASIHDYINENKQEIWNKVSKAF